MLRDRFASVDPHRCFIRNIFRSHEDGTFFSYPYCKVRQDVYMAQLTARTVLSTLSKRTLLPSAVAGHRNLATEASPEDYGYYPDPLEHATGREKKMLLARLAGDDRYEPKVYYRAENSTKERPNLIPQQACPVERIIRMKSCKKRYTSGHWWIRTPKAVLEENNNSAYVELHAA
ncbi:unnamed protein product [Cylicocyclus nassatus]|uniref:Uncharacterized protein n=1 Tax=Cylicocyclus nassatus TaxID=53992 RepID=A0AA36DSJ1_CYLNA|nr:unnamed protein product [Cylicocyclus nassatus]